MKRRTFLQQSSLAAAGLALSSCTPRLAVPAGKTHVLTLSFDDGFKQSFYRIAEIHEAYGLKACLNVIATGHLPDFRKVDDWILPEILGDFEDWNRLSGRGHEVMPHSWKHLNLTKIPVAQAQENILKCLNYFEENLDGYNPKQAVYNYAFDASTEALDAFTLQHVKAVRTGGWLLWKDQAYNAMPVNEQTGRLGCWTNGPDNNDRWVDQQINKFLKTDGGWLILNLHGLDNEGWGPISTSYLDKLLKRLVAIEKLTVLPAGEALAI
ncbi:MAG: polysaccharide deacetylase family protein [Bacteroidota bacterium]